MADSYVQVPADDVGKKIEMEEHTNSLGNVVQRQLIKVAEIDAAALPADYPLPAAQVATLTPPTLPSSYPVTDNGGSLTVDGSVSVSNFPATQPVSGSVTMEDVAVALYQVLQVLQRPMYVDPLTGRNRVLVESISSSASLGNITLIGSATPRDLFSFHAERNSWANSIGSRIT